MKKNIFTSLVAEDIQAFDKIFKQELKTKAKLLNVVTSYILKTKGKQLRPTLVFLGARLVDEVKEDTYSAAFMIELMHTATLLHDDVVDNAMKRRGFFSINALWKNKVAILFGDYLLAKGMLHALDKKRFDILQTISNAVREMSEGELLQIEKARNLSNSEEIYYEIIKKKTASLFVSAMVSGAESTNNATSEQLEKIAKIAELLGVAFQIKDDLLDYTKSSVIGKPTWNDLREQKMTLPLLYALQQVSTKQQQQIKKLLRKHKDNNSKLQEIVDFVYENGGIQYSEEKMKSLCNEAIHLCESFPQNEARDAIVALIDYVQTRKK